MTAASPAMGRTVIGRIEAWLDRRGPFAWIGLVVLAFLVFHHAWFLGLAVLGYAVLSGRIVPRFDAGLVRRAERRAAGTSSGNTAFDAHRADTLNRLEEEQAAFETFLERLRAAKGKAEFDDFMAERAWNRSGRRDA